jgi:hypothetical protein
LKSSKETLMGSFANKLQALSAKKKGIQPSPSEKN